MADDGYVVLTPSKPGRSTAKRVSTFGGMAAQLLPKRETARDIEEPEYLEKFVSSKAQLFKMLSPVRVSVFLAVACVSGIGVIMLDPTSFNVMVTMHDVQSHEGCVHYCELSRSSAKFGLMLPTPGVGDCWSNATNKSMVVWENCHRSHVDAKLMLCKEFTSTDHNFESDPLLHNKHVEEGLLSTRCRFPVTPTFWKPYVVILVLAVTFMLIIQGLPAQLLLIGSACILCPFGILTQDDVFKGLGNEGVVSLAVLFPLAEAISETGVLEKVVGLMLGSPKSLMTAIPRMMFPAAFVSAFLSNTATVALMIPILCAWARRLAIHPGKLMIPLSFAAQLGGCWTLVGSSHILVAKSLIPTDMYEMGFFDLLPLGVAITFISTVVITVLATTPFLSSSLAKTASSGAIATPQDVYKLRVVVTGFGGLVGNTIKDSGLGRALGVHSVRHSRVLDAREGVDPALEKGEELVVECSDVGVVTLRANPGLRLKNQDDLALLGARRRERQLFEVTIKSGSSVETTGFPDPSSLRRKYGACIVAGPKVHPGNDDDDDIKNKNIVVGSVILLEARGPTGNIGQNWFGLFSLVRQVPNSSPPRVGRSIDILRDTMTCLGLVVLIILATLNVCQLAYGGTILLMFYLLIRAISPQQLVSAIRGNILLIIVGALAISQGLQKSGIVSLLTRAVLSIGKPLGHIGILGTIYAFVWVLELFMNNTAVVAIVGPVLVLVAEADPTMNIKALVFTMIYAAGCSFTSPLGYQTNLMVMEDGQYSFGDFTRFGTVIQFCHLLVVIALVVFYFNT